MARLGFAVIGADASEQNIGTARAHAAHRASLDYRAVTAEELAEEGELRCRAQYGSGRACRRCRAYSERLCRPGAARRSHLGRHHEPDAEGAALAIFAREYVLGWLPRGTHQYEKLVRPEELEKPLVASGLEIIDRTGVFFNPLANQWNLLKDMDVNYMLLAKRPA